MFKFILVLSCIDAVQDVCCRLVSLFFVFCNLQVSPSEIRQFNLGESLLGVVVREIKNNPVALDCGYVVKKL